MRFFLHGWGSCGRDFRSKWESAGIKCGSDDVFLDGFDYEPFTQKRKWFNLTRIQTSIDEQLLKRIDDVSSLITDVLESRDFSPNTSIELIGHSQGGMLALAMLFQKKLMIKRVVAFASFINRSLLTARPLDHQVEVTSYSSLLDNFVNRDQVRLSLEAIAHCKNINVTDFLSDSLDHKFTDAWLDQSHFRSVPL